MRKSFLPFFCLLLACLSLTAQKKYAPKWESLDKRPIAPWFEDAKFGIFVHWGLYSVPAWGPTDKDFLTKGTGDWQHRIGMKYAEWYWQRIASSDSAKKFGYDAFQKHHTETYGKNFKYQDFAPHFKATNFDPDKWADIIRDAGAKYVVLTSKHHDGFALWPSKYSWNWNAGDVGAHRDLLGDLTKAVKNKGIKMGYYYSLYEWYNPLYTPRTLDTYIDTHMLPQMKELVVNYKPDILWGDGQWAHPSSTWKMPQFMAWLFNDSPVKDSIVINDRWGKDTWGEHGGYYTVEYGNIKDSNADLNAISKPWEECKGIGTSFGYNRNENLEDYASSEALVHDLIAKVSKGGNLLLNIGPTADGEIPVIMQQRLADIGGWLKVNAEAIYGSRKWAKTPKLNNPNVHFTTKGKDLYLMVTKYPESAIELPVSVKPSSISLLGSADAVNYNFNNGKVRIEPARSAASHKLQYAWVYKLANSL